MDETNDPTAVNVIYFVNISISVILASAKTRNKDIPEETIRMVKNIIELYFFTPHPSSIYLVFWQENLHKFQVLKYQK